MISHASALRFLVFLILALLCLVSFSSSSEETTQSSNEETAETCPTTTEDAPIVVDRRVPSDCRIVMAPSSLMFSKEQNGEGSSNKSNVGWGVFVLQPHRKGAKIGPPDVVVHVIDLLPQQAAAANNNNNNNRIITGLARLLQQYWWSAEETGGFYEGRHVVAHAPGIGMLANGYYAAAKTRGDTTTTATTSATTTTISNSIPNVLPFVPTVHEGGVTRMASHGAGAFTHYFNYSFYAQREISAGHEIWVNYGAQWVQERRSGSGLIIPLVAPTESNDHKQKTAGMNVDWLRQHGQCLDNIQPTGAGSTEPSGSTMSSLSFSSSSISHAGRGAVAARDLPQGSLVVPVPVLPLLRRDLEMLHVPKTTTQSRRRRHQNVAQLLSGACQFFIVATSLRPRYVACQSCQYC